MDRLPGLSFSGILTSGFSLGHHPFDSPNQALELEHLLWLGTSKSHTPRLLSSDFLDLGLQNQCSFCVLLNASMIPFTQVYRDLLYTLVYYHDLLIRFTY